ncbi:MAG: FtsQ-type POTRA domain-containing protein [Clostridia bacterium]|nr:FtsQ-type POTRA domain-containing protein [Clostridia bacterium]
MPDTEKWESSEKIKEIRRERKLKKIKRRKRFIITLLVLGVMIGILFTPIFNLKHIELNGVLTVSELEISDAAALTTGTNIFKFNINKIAENIEKIPYIDNAEVIRKYPNKIIINITEKVPVGYIEWNKNYVIIDSTGFCLEITPEKPFWLSDIVGVGIVTAEPGKKISVENITLLSELLELLSAIHNNEIDFKIASVYKEKDNYYITTSDIITVKLGAADQIDSKTAMLKEVLKQIPAETPGLIDATNSEKIYFKPNE